ncbi:MAG: nucleotidyltransferase domain-containing protein [Muribaculaceae bacterium]|nr:nucleotidyltransferase domain-containing protein [Muribaculaceae bacterium]
MKLIDLNIQRIFELCRLYKVRSLAVFGSILTDRFNEHSDVDMLVDFEPMDHEMFDYVSNYFNFRDALELLFNRKVDLIEEKALRNKYFISNVNRTKQIIYG